MTIDDEYNIRACVIEATASPASVDMKNRVLVEGVPVLGQWRLKETSESVYDKTSKMLKAKLAPTKPRYL